MACPCNTRNRDHACLADYSEGSKLEFPHNDENLADRKNSGGRNLEINEEFFNGICPKLPVALSDVKSQLSE